MDKRLIMTQPSLLPQCPQAAGRVGAWPVSDSDS